MQSPVFLAGVLLGCARRHPLRALRVLWEKLRTGWTAIRCPIVLNPLLLLAAGFLTEAAVGGGPALLLTVMLATQLPWRGGNRAVIGRVLGLEAPPFDEGAFEARIRPASDADLRQMADQLNTQGQGQITARQRQDLRLQIRILYRVLDERRSWRQAQTRSGPSSGARRLSDADHATLA